jgi:hypothetical protein
MEKSLEKMLGESQKKPFKHTNAKFDVEVLIEIVQIMQRLKCTPYDVFVRVTFPNVGVTSFWKGACLYVVAEQSLTLLVLFLSVRQRVCKYSSVFQHT